MCSTCRSSQKPITDLILLSFAQKWKRRKKSVNDDYITRHYQHNTHITYLLNGPVIKLCQSDGTFTIYVVNARENVRHRFAWTWTTFVICNTYDIRISTLRAPCYAGYVSCFVREKLKSEQYSINPVHAAYGTCVTHIKLHLIANSWHAIPLSWSGKRDSAIRKLLICFLFHFQLLVVMLCRPLQSTRQHLQSTRSCIVFLVRQQHLSVPYGVFCWNRQNSVVETRSFATYPLIRRPTAPAFYDWFQWSENNKPILFIFAYPSCSCAINIRSSWLNLIRGCSTRRISYVVQSAHSAIMTHIELLWRIINIHCINLLGFLWNIDFSTWPARSHLIIINSVPISRARAPRNTLSIFISALESGIDPNWIRTFTKPNKIAYKLLFEFGLAAEEAIDDRPVRMFVPGHCTVHTAPGFHPNWFINVSTWRPPE